MANIQPYMRKEAVSHYRTLQLPNSEFLIYEENLIFFIMSVRLVILGVEVQTEDGGTDPGFSSVHIFS